MSLFTQTIGNGPDVALLHGWGMNSDIWEDVIEDLSEYYRITVVDLPGHGRSTNDVHDPAVYTLEKLAEQIGDIIPVDSIVVGWSLGGLVATQIALDYPGRVKKLVLVASAPQFVKDENWPEGMDAEVLDGFAGDLQEDYKNTIKRFIAIQAFGSDNAREEQRIMRERIFRHGYPQLAALEGGLRILHESNLRPRLSEIKCPCLLLTGEHDSLFRQSAVASTLPLIKNAQLAMIKGAGHAPFLSHRKEFIYALKSFLDNE
jgi:pimeloyl-[acyl-carrier protein] methyl ester esterase